jgi:hypothetical protein
MECLNEEKVRQIIEETVSEWEGDNVFDGLLILSKYRGSGGVIEGSGRDEIYSISVDTAIENGITEEAVKELALLDWRIQDDYFYTFT